MIQQAYIQQIASFFDAFREFKVLVAWHRISRRMIVAEYDMGCT